LTPFSSSTSGQPIFFLALFPTSLPPPCRNPPLRGDLGVSQRRSRVSPFFFTGRLPVFSFFFWPNALRPFPAFPPVRKLGPGLCLFHFEAWEGRPFCGTCVNLFFMGTPPREICGATFYFCRGAFFIFPLAEWFFPRPTSVKVRDRAVSTFLIIPSLFRFWSGCPPNGRCLPLPQPILPILGSSFFPFSSTCFFLPSFLFLDPPFPGWTFSPVSFSFYFLSCLSQCLLRPHQ